MEALQPLVTYLAFGLYMLLLAVAAGTDIYMFKIPNTVSAVLLVAFVPVALASPHEVPWLSHLGAAAAVLAGGFVLFAVRWLGAGDVKLMTAVALWAGLPQLPAFLAYVSFAGGALALLLLTLRLAIARLAPERTAAGLPRLLVRGERVPYGVAIAAGAMLLGLFLPLLDLTP
jgi:prepilin peptidase CpaA